MLRLMRCKTEMRSAASTTKRHQVTVLHPSTSSPDTRVAAYACRTQFLHNDDSNHMPGTACQRAAYDMPRKSGNFGSHGLSAPLFCKPTKKVKLEGKYEEAPKRFPRRDGFGFLAPVEIA
jgi:hypothetical protein